MYLKLNRIIFPVYNLGPGCRAAIWLQGCKILCKGCINPELHNSGAGRKVEIASFACTLIEVVKNLDGLTISGGEPFDQYESLMAFCAFFKKKTGKHIYVYTGYTIEELFAKFPDKYFLRVIDLLNAGPYVGHLNQSEYFRGSANQRLYSFENENELAKSDEIHIKELPFIETENKWSVGVGEKSEIFLTGIPGKNDMKTIMEKMNQSGIKSLF